MFAHERHHRVLQLIGRRRRMRAQELQAELNISPATLRRDLAKLEEDGQIVRVHGGLMHPAYLNGEPSLEEKNRRGAEGKASHRATRGPRHFHRRVGLRRFRHDLPRGGAAVDWTR